MELSSAEKIRTRLGKLKFKLLHGLTYRYMAQRSEKMRSQLAENVGLLPPINFEKGQGNEVHMLCGLKQVDMAIWSSWSFMRFSPSMKLHVHSDGTLDEAARTLWRRVVPNVVFVNNESVEAQINHAYPKNFDLLKRWRKQHIYSAKVIDFHLYGDSEKLFLLDSDVLCLHKPTELLAALREPSEVCTWNEDEKSFYPTDLSHLRRITGVDVPPRFNSGLVVMRRMKTADFEFVENLLVALRANGIDISHHWTEQAIIATLSTRHHRSYALPDGYNVIKGKTTHKTIARHYVGTSNIRPRFYLEGVPMLIRQVQAK